jgi:Flp pilus assembly protein TadD
VSASRRDTFLALALFALPLLVFAPITEGAEFLNFDDDLYVTANPAVRAGLSVDTARWAFTNVESGHFHPLTWLSHAADVSLFGLDAGAHHRTSLVLHALATVLCFAFWRRLGVELGGALFAAALFAVHPLRVESVAWVATRKDVLSGALFFVTLLGWTWWRARPGAGRMAVTVATFVAALLAKPTVLPLPLLLLALDRWPLGAALTWARVREKGWLFGVSAVFAGVAVFGQGQAGAIAPLPLAARVLNAGAALVAYTGRLVAPLEVSLFHPARPLPPGLGVACVLIVVGVSVAAARQRLPGPLAMAWWWFLLLLLPVSGLVQIGGQFIADRWLYLPLSGVVVGVWASLRASDAARWSLAGLLVAAAAGLSRQHLPHYRTSEAAFRHALDVEPDNFLAHTNLGTALEQRGALDEAHLHYEEAVRLNPTWPTALINLGNVRARQGRLGDAEGLYRRALDREPSNGLAHYNLALALVMQGRPQEAVVHYADAVRLRPTDAMAALGHGATLLGLGRRDEGLAELRRAVALDPSSQEASERLRLAEHGP